MPDTRETETQRRQPDSAWFKGISSTHRGITYVTMSEAFGALFPGYTDEHGIDPLGIWRLYYGHRPDAKKSDDAKKLIAEAERLIRENTGFSAQDIDDFRLKLFADHKRKIEAPFRVELH